MYVDLTSQSLEWLQDHRIFFQRAGGQRLRPGGRLGFRPGCEIEPYSGFFVGDTVCPFGAMTFSNSIAPPKFSAGRYCSIGDSVGMILASHPIEYVSTSVFSHDPESPLTRAFARDHPGALSGLPNPTRPPPFIEHDVWIGAHALLLPGVVIGTGAVVAAGSVVTRSVGPYEIVGGNPARLIRKRFPDEVIAALLDSQWWRYRFTDFSDLGLDRPSEFVEAFRRRKPDLEPYDPPKARLDDMPHA